MCLRLHFNKDKFAAPISGADNMHFGGESCKL